MHDNYELIIIKEGKAFGIWETGKMIPMSFTNKGRLWGIDFLSELSDMNVLKMLIQKTYPNTSTLLSDSKKISNVPMLYREAIDEELLNFKNEPMKLRFCKHYFLINSDEPFTTLPSIDSNKN